MALCEGCNVKRAAYRLQCCGQQLLCCSELCAEHLHETQSIGDKLLALSDKKHDKKRMPLAAKLLLSVILAPACKLAFTLESKYGEGLSNLMFFRDPVWTGLMLMQETKTSRGKKQESVKELSKLTVDQYAALVQSFQATARDAVQSHSITMAPVKPNLVCPLDRKAHQKNWQQDAIELQFLLLDMINTWRGANDFGGPKGANMKSMLVDNIHQLADELVKQGAEAGVDDEAAERILKVFFGKGK
jgi:hypothetical protein